MQAARGAMDAAVGLAKRQAVELGYIVVLQTAGRVAKYNPQLHVFMTAGGWRGGGGGAGGGCQSRGGGGGDGGEVSERVCRAPQGRQCAARERVSAVHREVRGQPADGVVADHQV